VREEVFVSFKNHLQGLEKEHFTTKELLERFSKFSGGYAYSPHYFSHLLRSKMQLYYKPSPQDYRRPCDAETKLLERFRATLDALRVAGKDVSEFTIGFGDESAAQLHHNNASSS
jgi:hypothetical protein